MYIQMSLGNMKKTCLLIEVSHGNEELRKSSCCVQQNGINTNVPICIIKVYPSDVWHPHLEMVTFVPHMEHTSWKPGEIWVYFEKDFKFIISNLPMLIPTLLISVHKSFFPLPVCGRHIKNFVTLLVTHMEGLLHFQHINFQGQSHHRHGYHYAKGNAHSSFLLWQNLVFIQDLHKVQIT
jgi:hypothetical protein